MSSSGRRTPSSSHIRKRRAHKRSRNGCITCKQRHIRCDELKPVCTNCLTRGGDCGYPDAGSKSTPGSGSGPGDAGIPESRMMRRAEQLRLLMFPTSPADPVDTLPIKMPHRSMELFNHFVNYRIFSRTPVPKTQNSACIGMVFGGPGIFRAGILLTALHYSWISPSGSLAHTDMEETYLYHKLEAMRHVNQMVADTQSCTTDDCIGLIAALAMAESGMGDIAAAEAHLNGLSTLVNMRRPEEWQHRFWGILQRIILVTGSFIAAAKKPELGGDQDIMSAIDDSNFNTLPPQYPYCPSSTGPAFSTTPFIATRLSPFYMGSTPDLEACKDDAEAEVLMNSLRRLSSLAGTDGETCSSSRRSSPQVSISGGSSNTRGQRMPQYLEPVLPHTLTIPPYTSGSAAGSVAGTARSGSLSADGTDEGVSRAPGDYITALLADTDTYIISLFFKPQPICPESDKTAQAEGQEGHNAYYSHGVTPSLTLDIDIDPALTESSNTGAPDPQTYPYASLPPEQFPSSSRAWASAAYLYLHIMLEPLWVDPNLTRSDASRRKTTAQQPPKQKAIDNPYLMRLLIDTLKSDIQHTEQAMRAGMYSKELWIWMVTVGAYTIAFIDERDVWLDSDGDGRTRLCPEGAGFTEKMATRLGGQPKPSPRCPRQTHMESHSPLSGSWIGSPAGDASSFIMDPFDKIHQTLQDNCLNQDSYFPPFSSHSSPSSGSESGSEDRDTEPYHQFQHEAQHHSPQRKRQNQPQGRSQETGEDYIPSLKRFFSSCMQSWSQTSCVTSWEGARQNISKIAWPEHIPSVETISTELWEDAMMTREKSQPYLRRKDKGKDHTTT